MFLVLIYHKLKKKLTFCSKLHFKFIQNHSILSCQIDFHLTMICIFEPMTKIVFYSCFSFLLFLFVSCGNDYGNKLESDELDVFYTKIENEEFARNIAIYWKEHDLLASKKQSIQLDEKDGVLILKVIPTEKFDASTFSFDERALLKQLQDSLQSHVQPKRLEVVISKNNFETIFNIN